MVTIERLPPKFGHQSSWDIIKRLRERADSLPRGFGGVGAGAGTAAQVMILAGENTTRQDHRPLTRTTRLKVRRVQRHPLPASLEDFGSAERKAWSLGCPLRSHRCDCVRPVSRSPQIDSWMVPYRIRMFIDRFHMRVSRLKG